MTLQPFSDPILQRECIELTADFRVDPDSNPFFYTWRINEVSCFVLSVLYKYHTAVVAELFVFTRLLKSAISKNNTS